VVRGAPPACAQIECYAAGIAKSECRLLCEAGGIRDFFSDAWSL